LFVAHIAVTPAESILSMGKVKVIICKTIGHKVTCFDSGYPICDRCGAHGYHDSDVWDYYWFNWVYRWRAWAWNAWQWMKKSNAYGNGYMAGLRKWVGIKRADDDDMPF
jgi:hypothetical protein